MSNAVPTQDVSNPDSLCEVVPIPPRYRWLKRFAKAGVLLVIGVLLLRIGWGMIAQHRLDTLIDSYRAAGQLVTAADFDAALDAVPDEKNAAILYEEAMESYVGTTKSGVLLSTFLDDITNIETHPIVADEFMRGNSDVLAVIHRATDLPDVAWSHRLQDSLGSTPLLGAQRMVARVLYLASAYQLIHGNDAEAMETLYDWVSFNDAVGSHPSLLSNLVSWACHSFCFSFLEHFGESIRVSPSDTPIHNQCAHRDQLSRLIELLLDERRCRESARLGHRGDRAFFLSQLEFIERFRWEAIRRRGLLSMESCTGIAESIIHPIYVLDAWRMASYATKAADISDERDWPAASQLFSAASQEETVVRLLVRPWSYMAGYRTQQSTAQGTTAIFFRHLARRRMAAIALAIRLYQVDHGTRPTELAELVPKYLTTLPLDPFAINGATFVYKPLAPRPLLYSVGPNGADDGGRKVKNVSGARGDIPFFLAPESSADTNSEDGSSLETGDDGE